MKIVLPFLIFCCFFINPKTSVGQVSLSCIDSALYLNGNNEYVKLPSNGVDNANFLPYLNGDYTIECLIKWNGGADFQRIFDFNFGTGAFMFLTTSENVNHVPRFAISTNALGGAQVVDANIPLIPDIYHHIAITYSKANSLLNIFIDGQVAGSGTVTIAADSVFYGSDMHDSSNNYIGLSAFTGDPSLNADIDEFRISNTVRYTASFIPSVPFVTDSSTIALYHFNEGSGQLAYDSSANNYTAQLGSTPDIDDNDPTWVSCSSVLASSWLNFTATNNKGQVALNWRTASNDVKDFVVERSTDGIDFKNVNAVGGNANNTLSSYSYIDISPSFGSNYYRLKQESIDGSSTYSNIIYISVDGVNGFRVYPTIAVNQLHVTVTQTPTTLVIYNTKGEAVEKLSVNNTDEDINVSVLPAGVYFVRNLVTNTSVRFIKQ